MSSKLWRTLMWLNLMFLLEPAVAESTGMAFLHLVNPTKLNRYVPTWRWIERFDNHQARLQFVIGIEPLGSLGAALIDMPADANPDFASTLSIRLLAGFNVADEFWTSVMFGRMKIPWTDSPILSRA
jgi:hypothetical protein